MILLREACARDEWRARPWTLLGSLLVAMGHRDEAIEAFEVVLKTPLAAVQSARNTFSVRAALSDITPFGVDRIEMPRPLRTRPRSLIDE